MATKAQVRETYRKHFQATRDSADAWNLTLDELAPAYSREMSKQEEEERHRVGELLREVQERVDLEEGDPLSMAVDSAMKSLKRDNFVAAVREQAKELHKTAKEEAKKEGISIEKFEERYPHEVMAYIEFDDAGNLENWTIDHAQYYQGHGGPVAAVFVSSGVTWDDVESEIGETLSQADIEWKEEEEEVGE